MSDPFTVPELLAHAGRAIGKVDARGPRGAEKVTTDEIIAMAMLLAVFGVPSTPFSPPVSNGANQ